eukprot:NODE_5027_length_731_cov_21.200331_g5004_i0.p1 GENE.NODE_5027_length_731_cov_21.200331_g5004_i0~~NODE_5027_length_731_cov_21.200331_g5004_i0.p1  ORF type:complete len:227 (-),score=48.12 NODE_5027_length_731_cov_21.200331_g5004_i0:51-689(-)
MSEVIPIRRLPPGNNPVQGIPLQQIPLEQLGARAIQHMQGLVAQAEGNIINLNNLQTLPNAPNEPPRIVPVAGSQVPPNMMNSAVAAERRRRRRRDREQAEGPMIVPVPLPRTTPRPTATAEGGAADAPVAHSSTTETAPLATAGSDHAVPAAPAGTPTVGGGSDHFSPAPPPLMQQNVTYAHAPDAFVHAPPATGEGVVTPTPAASPAYQV